MLEPGVGQFREFEPRRVHTADPALKTQHAFLFRVSLTRGSVFKVPGPLFHRPWGQRRHSICQKTRIRSRNATTKRCCLKPTAQGDLKAASYLLQLFSNTRIPSFEFPSPTETREGVQHDQRSVMCTVVRWCCCRLLLLMRRCPHGEHHIRFWNSDTIQAQATCHMETIQNRPHLGRHYLVKRR